MSMTDISELKIFWRGEEVDGVLAYAVTALHGPPIGELLRGVLPIGAEVKEEILAGEGWAVTLFNIKISEWPADVVRWLRELLSTLVPCGAYVAWLGFEGMFTDPPFLFDPGHMSGGVYAAFSRTHGLFFHARGESAFEPLSDSELLLLKKEFDSSCRTL